MLEKLTLDGTMKGSYDGNEFRIESKGHSLKIFFSSVNTIKALKDAFFDQLKQYKNDPRVKKLMEEFDFEVYLKDELIIRVGKNAKSNFVSSMLGLSNLEVVSNSQMSDLMSLM